jgi:hypothetical protein
VKRSVLALVAALALPLFTAQAQSTQTRAIGLIAGMASSRLEGDDASDDLSRVSRPMFGLSAVYGSRKRAGIEIDALYVTKGFKSTGSTGEFELTTSYVEIPLQLRLRLGSYGKPVQPWVGAGVAMGVRVGCNTTTTAGGTSTKADCVDGVVGSVARMDYSSVMNAGIDFTSGQRRLTLGVRRTEGFTSVLEDLDNHNMSWAFYLGLSRVRAR